MKLHMPERKVAWAVRHRNDRRVHPSCQDLDCDDMFQVEMILINHANAGFQKRTLSALAQSGALKYCESDGPPCHFPDHLLARPVKI